MTEPPVVTEWGCDFEEEGDWLCGMREVAAGWQVKAGWDAVEGTNPPVDHTTASGDGELMRWVEEKRAGVRRRWNDWVFWN